MRRLFFLIAIPLLFDACFAAGLAASGTAELPPPRAEAANDYIILFDWDGVKLLPAGRPIAAATLRARPLWRSVFNTTRPPGRQRQPALTHIQPISARTRPTQ